MLNPVCILEIKHYALTHCVLWELLWNHLLTSDDSESLEMANIVV